MQMRAYVLVGGAWLGGWCWQKVARRMRDDGHDAESARKFAFGDVIRGDEPLEVLGEQT